jgi:hypothetical protein
MRRSLVLALLPALALSLFTAAPASAHNRAPKAPAEVWTTPVVPHEMVFVSDGILMLQTRSGPGRCPSWHLQRIATRTGWHTLRFDRWMGCTYRATAPYSWHVGAPLTSTITSTTFVPGAADSLATDPQ